MRLILQRVASAAVRVEGEVVGEIGRGVLVLAGGAFLIVSQFTLMADLSRGRRPSLGGAAPPDVAAPLIDELVADLERRGFEVASGRFGAHMQVELVNDGPVTFVLDL